MEYITFMHGNPDTTPSAKEWGEFIRLANQSGLFRGGSAIGKRSILGAKEVPDITAHVKGYMRFDAESPDELFELLSRHPVAVHGGTIEVCELPRSD